MEVIGSQKSEKTRTVSQDHAGPESSVNHIQYESFKDNVIEDDILPVATPTIGKYWYRWYICVVFALLGLFQGAVWNTWSPIDESAECALGFTSGDIDLLTNWGPITFIVTMPFFMWLLDRKGLRLPTVLTASLVAVGTGLRCLPLPTNILRYFIHAGQMLNGVAGCVVMATPPLLSNVWFPPEERVTATSITTLLNYMGTGAAYIVGPLMVQEPTNTTHNKTLHESFEETMKCNNTHEQAVIRRDIQNLMYLEFGLSMAVFLSMLIFFPNKPPSPPSASASVGRMDFLEGLLALRKKRTFLGVSVTFSLVVGGYGGWTGAMSVIMTPLGVSQDEAGKLGFFMTLVGCFIGLVIGWFADRFRGHTKLIITILFVICFFCYLYYITMSQGWIKTDVFEFSDVGLWITCILIGITLNACVPLGMEMGADSAYPTSEAISTSVIVWCYNVVSFILLMVLQLTNPSFTNYLMLGFVGVSIPLMIFFTREPNNRMMLDLHPESVEAAAEHKQPLLDSNLNPGSNKFPDYSSFGSTNPRC